ncbi:UPF0182 family membrane protein [Sanguibacter sp. A247]|uniref:UPF0182 family membrane protein n=1 Tax=unclassified Sanguibacter TaxID=2645534 RepID=UPI003FD7C6E6
MAFTRPPARPRPAAPGERRKLSPLGVTIGVLAAIVAVVVLAARFWTEVLWFKGLGFERVLLTEWGMRAGLFVVGFLVMGVAVGVNLHLAWRNRPVYAPSTPEQATLDQYREAVEPLRRVVTFGAPALLGLFAGGALSARWEMVLLWINGQDFGVADPEHGLDVSFYTFTLPGLRMVVSTLLAIVVVSLIGAAAMHYLYGGIRLGSVTAGESRTTRSARVHLSVLAAIVMLLLAANYWLDRYAILLSSAGGVTDAPYTGATYSDVHAVIPARAILAGVAIIVAILFLITAVRGSWKLPAIGVGLMIVSAVAIGALYPAFVERFQVRPNAQELESEYIQRNIDATRTAFGIDKVEVTDYDAKTTATAGALREDSETAASIRLLDPAIVSPTFTQLQQNRQYYAFSRSLQVDRYEIDGEKRDTVIAVRELNQAGLGEAQRNWVNDHTVYTHGFGVVAAYGNAVSKDGQPSFFEGGIPSVGELGEYEPRIYFGQNSPTYSIVGAPEGRGNWELDYPDNDEGQVMTTFPTGSVDAGPTIGNAVSKLLFAVRFGDEQILFSDRVTSESQILYDRDPRERVQKIAPYLTLDSRVYPAVVDGRVKWIVDGYTTSADYPYATQQQLEAMTDDTAARNNLVAEVAPQTVNYIRNSVKATVDAFDGSVTLYAWDTEDPVLKTWQKIFPASFTPVSEISGDLMSHIRYPEDFFKVQRSLLARYHVTESAAFFSSADFWQTPFEPTSSSETNAPLQPPYYLTLQMPGQDVPSFSLMSTFIPGGATTGQRQVLTGYLAADAEAGNKAGTIGEGYGKLRLLTLPKDNAVPAPGNVQNNFDTDARIADAITGLRVGNATVVSGNLLTLPVGGGLLYVQPVYVQSSSGTKIPLMRKVLVSFGDQVGLGNTLGQALDDVFGGNSGAETDEDPGPTAPTTPPVTDPTTPPADPTTPSEPTTEPADPATPPAPGTPAEQLATALADAEKAINAADTALKAGDFAAYGEAQKSLEDAIARAIAAQGSGS